MSIPATSVVEPPKTSLLWKSEGRFLDGRGHRGRHEEDAALPLDPGRRRVGPGNVDAELDDARGFLLRIIRILPGDRGLRGGLREPVVLRTRLGGVPADALQLRELPGEIRRGERIGRIRSRPRDPPRLALADELDDRALLLEPDRKNAVLGQIPVEIPLRLPLGGRGHLALEEEDEKEEREDGRGQEKELARGHGSETGRRAPQSRRRYQTQTPRITARIGMPATAKIPIRFT
jgi:hypothetical protein